MTSRTDQPHLDIAAWRDESRDSDAALQRLLALVAEREPHIHALVPEDGRAERLRRDIATCAAGPLSRVPIGVKDIIHVDGLPTRAGSRLPLAELAGPEATAVKALRGAGGAVLGKTVSTEFAYFAPGPTRNPRNFGHTPGGSSSGSAAAVAAGYCPLALGTQTIGSISRPAAFCGIVGFKPTYGRIDLTGVIPLSPSLDHLGVFASNVADAGTAAAVLCHDWTPATPDRKPILGIPRGPYLERASGAALDHFQRLCGVLQDRGWSLQTVDLFGDFPQIEARHQIILAAEVARVHDDWYRRFGELYHPKTRQLIERGQATSETELGTALAAVTEFRQRLESATARAGVDLWLSPAAPGPAPRGLDSTGDPVMNLPWTQAGVPTLSLPAGTGGDSDLPLGLQVAGRWHADETLLAWCEDLAHDLQGMS